MNKRTNLRTNLKARAAIDSALADCKTQAEKDALIFGDRLALNVLRDTEQAITKEA